MIEQSSSGQFSGLWHENGREKMSQRIIRQVHVYI